MLCFFFGNLQSESLFSLKVRDGKSSISSNLQFPFFFRIAGNAAFILGSILEDPTGRRKTMHLLQDEKHADDTSYLLPSLTALIQTHEPEAMTNASGTLSLLV